MEEKWCQTFSFGRKNDQKVSKTSIKVSQKCKDLRKNSHEPDAEVDAFVEEVDAENALNCVSL